MSSKYSKLFTTTNPLSHKSVTILVERSNREIAITTLEGEYGTVEKFNEALDNAINNRDENEIKVFNFISFMKHEARPLIDALGEASRA